MGYVGLHHHTTYSFLDSIGQVKDHVSRVEELGMSAMAITDYNALYGAMDLYKNVKGSTVKPIIGVDMPWVRQLGSREPQHRGYITLLARNVDGYHTLLRLVSAAYMRRESGDVPFLDMDLLRKDCDDVVLFWGGVKSRYGQAVLRGESVESIQDEGRVLIDMMGQENVFAEVVAQDYALLSDVRRINERVISDAQDRGIELFVSNNVHYIHQSDTQALEVAYAIKDNKKIYEEDRRKVIGEYHIVDGSWIMQMMQRNGYDESTVQKRIDQTQAIADSINIKVDMGETLFPNYEVSEHLKSLYEREKDGLVVE